MPTPPTLRDDPLSACAKAEHATANQHILQCIVSHYTRTYGNNARATREACTHAFQQAIVAKDLEREATIAEAAL